jgi:pilus assembly protein Flp/PilA
MGKHHWKRKIDPPPLHLQARHTEDLVMRSYFKGVIEFMKREDGPTAVEYAVMLALIVVVCITAITAIGSSSNTTFSRVGSAVKGS